MKFYIDKFNYYFFTKIKNNSLTAIIYYSYARAVQFFKNGKIHNSKNAGYISADLARYIAKEFYLNGIIYGNSNNFTKKSWRRFVKLQAFL